MTKAIFKDPISGLELIVDILDRSYHGCFKCRIFSIVKDEYGYFSVGQIIYPRMSHCTSIEDPDKLLKEIL